MELTNVWPVRIVVTHVIIWSMCPQNLALKQIKLDFKKHSVFVNDVRGKWC